MISLGRDTQLDLEAPLRNAEIAVEDWLKEEQITLPTKKKQRIAALVAHLFHDAQNATPDMIGEYLGTLAAGGDFDLDDPGSIALEIQRVLGQSEPLSNMTYRPFLKAGIILLIFNLLFLAGNFWLISYAVYEEHGHAMALETAYLTPEQFAELEWRVERIAEEESNLIGVSLNSDYVWQIMTETRGIASIDQIPQSKYISIKDHLLRWQGKIDRYEKMLADKGKEPRGLVN